MGARIALVNEGLPMGGTCVNVGCVPSKTLIRAAEAHHRALHHQFMSSGGKLQSGRWHDLQLDWDCEAWRCQVALDGERLGSLHLRRECDVVSYLRLRSIAGIPEAGSLMVEAVEADVSASWSTPVVMSK